MKILLQHPGVLWWAPLIAVPALLHFLARAKPPRFQFTAVAFIKKAVRHTARIKRPKDLLLLVCRTLLFSVLLAIFLRPVIFPQQVPLDRQSARDLVMVVDRSASMAWSEGGRHRFAAACEEADDILAGLSMRDRANIIWLDREPQAEFPEMGSNIAYLRQRIRDARVTNESGNPSGALRLALRQFENSRGRRELCIVSDFQTAQWKDVHIALPEDITVTTLCPARAAAENGAVVSVRTDPADPLVGEPVQVVCSIANYSTAPRNRTVILEIDEERVVRQVQLPAWGQGTVAVDHVFTGRRGPTLVSARLDEDAFGADDWRGMIVPLRKRLKVGIMGADPLAGPVWRRALRALPWVDPVELDPTALADLSDYDLLMLSGLQDTSPEISAAVADAHIPIIFSPTPGQPSHLLSLLTHTAAFERAPVILEPLDPSLGLTITDASERAFSLFSDGAFGDPAQAAFRRRLRLPKTPETGKALVNYMDGQPALWQWKAASPKILWLAPLTPQDSDWAAQAPFLPFLGELIRTMRSYRPQRRPPATALTGERLRFDAYPHSDGLRLMDEAGQTFPVTQIDSAADGTRMVSQPMEKPGVYRLCQGSDCPSAQIVNFPVAESDLRIDPQPRIAKAKVRRLRHGADFDAAHAGLPLWKWLAWGAIGLICMESALVWLQDLEARRMAVKSL
jgi:hypothetical protein